MYKLLLDDTPRVLADKVLRSMPTDDLIYVVLVTVIMKPALPSSLTYVGDEVCEFGYDPSIDDYKVVVVKVYWTDHCFRRRREQSLASLVSFYLFFKDGFSEVLGRFMSKL